jgi:hypothetical protein
MGRSESGAPLSFASRGNNRRRIMSDDPRLSNLMTYTTFHIGVYISLITAFIGANILGAHINEYLLRFSSLCVFLAGVFGGFIGSNIPRFQCYDDLARGQLEAFGRPGPTLERAIHLEHLFFWVGVLPLAFTFIFGGANALK